MTAIGVEKSLLLISADFLDQNVNVRNLLINEIEGQNDALRWYQLTESLIQNLFDIEVIVITQHLFIKLLDLFNGALLRVLLQSCGNRQILQYLHICQGVSYVSILSA